MINIYLTDDHKVLAECMHTAFSTSDRIRIVETFTTLDSCRKALEVERPDILLLDLSMPDGDGIDFCREVTKAWPRLKVIALTMHNECSVVKRTMESGARGYLLKSVSCEELLEAVDHVYNGDIYYCQEIAAQLRKYSSEEIVSLTNREREVLQLLVKGRSNKEIAKELFISPLTVKWHRTNILTKFNIDTMERLIAKVMQKRMII